jgi:hypothetical protein
LLSARRPRSDQIEIEPGTQESQAQPFVDDPPDKQSEKAEERDPVCHAHECGMPREIRFGVRSGG